MKTVRSFVLPAIICITTASHAQNTKIGLHALEHITNTNAYNSAFGYYALFNNVTAFGNTATGAYALRENTGDINTANGVYALRFNTTGKYNTSIGGYSLYYNTTGNENTAVGYRSLFSNKDGVYNTAIGNMALYSSVNEFYNTAVGYTALYMNTGSYNTAIGAKTLYNNGEGVANTAVGYSVLNANTLGGSNTGMGHGALNTNSTGSANNGYGRYALYNNTTGSNNNAFGYQALYQNQTGFGNVAAGHNSLATNTTGNNNTAIGYAADVSVSNLSNATAIGYNAKVDASNKVRIGNTSVTSIGGRVGWTIFSDGRFKTNIKENVAGLDFIKALRPVTYNLDVRRINARLNDAADIEDANAKTIAASMDNAADAASKIVYSGFIAQEVEAAAQKLNYNFSGVDKPESKNGLYGLRYDNFIIPLVKAVQELAKQNDDLKEQNNALAARIEKLEQKQNAQSALSISNPVNIKVPSVALEQNQPNPFNNNSIIRYNLPGDATNVQLVITNTAGTMVKTALLKGKGRGQLSINANEFAAGNYFYTLIVNGKKTETKQMMISK